MKSLLALVIFLLLGIVGLCLTQQDKQVRLAAASVRLDAAFSNAVQIVRPGLGELERCLDLAGAEWRDRTEQLTTTSNLLRLSEARLRRSEAERAQESACATAQLAKIEQDKTGLKTQNAGLSEVIGKLKTSLHDSKAGLARSQEDRLAAESEIARLRAEKASLNRQLTAAIQKLKCTLIEEEGRLAHSEEGRLQALTELTRLRAQQASLEQKLQSLKNSHPLASIKLHPVQPLTLRYQEQKGAETLLKGAPFSSRP